jgi:opacity protein-like surface antigen
LPEELNVENLNKNMSNRTMNRKLNVMEQIQDQYKGKLKYKPTNNRIVNYRKGRFYTSVYMMFNKTSVKEIRSDNTQYDVKSGDFKNSATGNIGVYFGDNMALEFEYFDFSGNIKTNDNIYEEFASTSNNSFKTIFKNFFINFILENNYTNIIPFFGIGVGLVEIKVENQELSGEGLKFKGDTVAAYQVFAGFDIAITDNAIASLKYKMYGLTDSFDMVIKTESTEKKFRLVVKNESMFNIGFKYLW